MSNPEKVEQLIYLLNNQLINNVLTFNTKIKQLIPNPDDHSKFLLNVPNKNIIIPHDIKIKQEMVKILREDINTVNNQLSNLHSTQNIKINQSVNSAQPRNNQGLKPSTNKPTRHIGFLNRKTFGNTNSAPRQESESDHKEKPLVDNSPSNKNPD